MRAGSRKPRDALVGVTSHPPSSSLKLILPDEPGVSPRSNRERPKRQISSRSLVSSMEGLRLFRRRTKAKRNSLGKREPRRG